MIFGKTAEPPDQELRDAFVRAIGATIQVKGNFYTKEGREAAIPEMARRLIEGDINKPDAFIDPPPRLEAAAAQRSAYRSSAMSGCWPPSRAVERNPQRDKK